MLKTRKTPEAELVERVANVLRESWDEVYHSVRFLGYEIDLVAVRMRGDELQTLCVEAKQRMNAEAFGKALIWSDWSTFVMVAANEACVWWDATRFATVGLYTPAFMREAIHTGARKDFVQTTANAARLSSNGTIIQGGSSSPRKATNITLLAEKVLKLWHVETGPFMSVRDSLPEDVDKATVKEVVKELRKHVTVRDFKTDYLVIR